MNNPIKFRGFRVDGKGWVEGDLMQKYVHHNGLTIVQGGCIYTEIHPSSLGMFTGLTDKNGKEIYGAIGNKGGDVVQVDAFGITNNRVVSYVSQSARFHLMGTTHDNLYEALHDLSGKNCSEIIGNQWEVDNGK